MARSSIQIRLFLKQLCERLQLVESFSQEKYTDRLVVWWLNICVEHWRADL